MKGRRKEVSLDDYAFSHGYFTRIRGKRYSLFSPQKIS